MLDNINNFRKINGKTPLCLNYKLMTSAQLHSVDQANNNTMSHTGSNGSTMTDRINATGFNWNTIGENVAYGYTDIPSVMLAWENSPSHRENMLGNFNMVGFGMFNNYWTQNFGLSYTESCFLD